MEHSELNTWVSDRLATLERIDWQPDTSAGVLRLRRRQEVHRRVRRLVLAGVVASIGSAGVLVYPATRVLAQRCVAACIGETARLSALVWPPRSSLAGATEAAPDFILTDAAGRPVRLSDFRGKVVLLNFWATWCSPCRAEIPWFSGFQQAYGDLVVLGVSLDEDGWTSVKPFIDNHPVRYRVMIGTDDVALRYGVSESLPVTLLIDRSGRIAARHVGLVDKAVYENEIESLIAQRDHGVHTGGADGGQQDRQRGDAEQR